ncbi:MAG: 4Fe-4S dicluster domain-containing protein [Sphingobacteriales bacterium]
MEFIPQILFILILGAAIWAFSRKINSLIRNIRLGRKEQHDDQPYERWKNVLLLAFGQKKMFAKPLVAILHFIIYVGFIIINLEVLEILIDGIFGTHRIFAQPLGNLYRYLINSFEVLAFLVIVVCIVFLHRRNVHKIKRFNQTEINGWPRSDANFILITEIVLMSLFLILNAADALLQENGVAPYANHATGSFMISGLFLSLLKGYSSETLIYIEQSAWWLHIIGILAFLNYLPYSKHLHILFAFPNAYYARLTSPGKMTNMPEIQREVLYAMQPENIPAALTDQPKRFGAKDVTDLSWRNLLDAYSCTECGRCTAACPANITGKSLSPRKIMMDTRDRMEELGRSIDKTGNLQEDGKSLLHDYIKPEEIRACTTCNACVDACPVAINPLDIILQLRRYQVMEESQVPAEWTNLFSTTETSMAPWKFSPMERENWKND